VPDTTVRGSDAEPAAPFRPLPSPPPPWRRLVDLARQQWPDRRRRVVASVVVALVVVVAAIVVTTRVTRSAAPAPELSLPRATPAPDPAGASAAGTAAGTAGGAAAGAAPVVVHVAGAVAHTGVYSLAAGSRVNDAVAAAGGPVGDADLDQLDLAAHVNDGDRVYVPRRGEQPPPTAGVGGSPGAATVVDINSADAEQLDALPGVGPSLAAAIVEYRRQHGRFRSAQDLLQVPGIGDAKLAALRSKVKVGA
jgi:competence protein ComEA